MTPDQIAEQRRQKYNATIVRLRKVHSDLLLMRVRPDGPLPPHRSGQYTTLGLGYWEPGFPGCQDEDLTPADEGKLIRRQYSISCPVVDDHGALLDQVAAGWLEFYIVLVRETDTGRPPALTPRLFMMREGDRLHLGEKVIGHYTLEGVGPDDAVVMLSTGTGEAPHNYMLWELLHRGHRGPILAACCVRYRRDLAYLEVHEQLAARHPNYHYVPLTTREPGGAGGKVYIQDLLTSGELEQRLGASLDPAHSHVYLCGNPKMIGAPHKDRTTGETRYPDPPGVVGLLMGGGFQPDLHAQKVRGHLHFEEYW